VIKDTQTRAKILRFLAVGATLTLIHIALGWLISRQMPEYPVTAAVLAYFGAAVAGYLSQRIITFRSTTPHQQAVPRFAVMVALGIAVSLTYALVLTRGLGFHPMVAIILASVTVPVVNYLAMDRMIFPDQK
jgi:putative flippase GtrA